jgi:hypothetical protein
VANAATQKVNASIAALEQIAGAMGLDLDAFFGRLAGSKTGDVNGGSDGARSIAPPVVSKTRPRDG